MEQSAATNAYDAAIKQAYNTAAANTTGVAKLNFEKMRDVSGQKETMAEFSAAVEVCDQAMDVLTRLAKTDKAVAEVLQGCNQDINKAHRDRMNALNAGQF